MLNPVMKVHKQQTCNQTLKIANVKPADAPGQLPRVAPQELPEKGVSLSVADAIVKSC